MYVTKKKKEKRHIHHVFLVPLWLVYNANKIIYVVAESHSGYVVLQ